MATKKPTPKKTATPKPEATTIDREQLLALGTELNTLLFEGNEVEYDDMDDEALEAQIRQDCTEIDPVDKFSDESKAIIAELNIDIEWAAAPKKATGKAAPAKAAPAKAEKAAIPAKEDKKPAAAKKAGVPRTASPENIARKKLIEKMIEGGKSTAAQIMEKVAKKFPDVKESGTRTILSDSKNPKYTPFGGKVAKVDAKGVLSF